MQLGLVTYQWGGVGFAHTDQKLRDHGVSRSRTAHNAQTWRRAGIERYPAERGRQAVRRQPGGARRAGERLRIPIGGSGRRAEEYRRREGVHPALPRCRRHGRQSVPERPAGRSAGGQDTGADRPVARRNRRVCAGYGVEIRLEIHGRGTSEIPNIRKIMDVSKHSGSKLCWNCNAEDSAGAGIAANFQSVQDRLGTVHVHDLISSYPWPELFALLKKADFQGWTLLEEGSPTADPLRVMPILSARLGSPGRLNRKRRITRDPACQQLPVQALIPARNAAKWRRSRIIPRA